LGMQRCSLTLHSRCGGVGGVVQDARRSASASPFPQGTPEMDAATAQEYQEHQDALRNTSAASSRVSASLMQQFDESRSPTLAPEVRHRAAAPPSQLDWIPLLLCCRVQSLSPTAAWSCCTLPTSLTLTRNTLHVQFASLSSPPQTLTLSLSLRLFSRRRCRPATPRCGTPPPARPWRASRRPVTRTATTQTAAAAATTLARPLRLSWPPASRWMRGSTRVWRPRSPPAPASACVP
jgi:hypothetical protein